MSFIANLIVCDVDGTLLNKHEQKPNRKVLDMIEQVVHSGKIFSLASGRSCNALIKLFGNDKIYYICSDGAYIVKNNTVVHKKPINAEILDCVLPKLNGSDFVLYGKEYAYASSKNIADIIFDAENGKVKPVSSYINEEIFKLSVFKPHTYATHYIKINNLLRECYCDATWIEYVSKEADKGSALEYLQNKLNIPFEKTAVFGDNLNDIHMMKKAYYSYAAGDAKPEIRLLARYYTQNTETEILNKFL